MKTATEVELETKSYFNSAELSWESRFDYYNEIQEDAQNHIRTRKDWTDIRYAPISKAREWLRVTEEKILLKSATEDEIKCYNLAKERFNILKDCVTSEDTIESIKQGIYQNVFDESYISVHTDPFGHPRVTVECDFTIAYPDSNCYEHEEDKYGPWQHKRGGFWWYCNEVDRWIPHADYFEHRIIRGTNTFYVDIFSVLVAMCERVVDQQSSEEESVLGEEKSEDNLRFRRCAYDAYKMWVESSYACGLGDTCADTVDAIEFFQEEWAFSNLTQNIKKELASMKFYFNWPKKIATEWAWNPQTCRWNPVKFEVRTVEIEIRALDAVIGFQKDNSEDVEYHNDICKEIECLGNDSFQEVKNGMKNKELTSEDVRLALSPTEKRVLDKYFVKTHKLSYRTEHKPHKPHKHHKTKDWMSFCKRFEGLTLFYDKKLATNGNLRKWARENGYNVKFEANIEQL